MSTRYKILPEQSGELKKMLQNLELKFKSHEKKSAAGYYFVGTVMETKISSVH